MIDPFNPIVAALAAGDCEAQVGGTLRITVQVRVAVVDPLLAFTVNVLFPGFNWDESTAIEFVVSTNVEPFNDHVTAQLVSLGVMPKVVLVLPALRTRYEVCEGISPLNVQTGNTRTAQLHVAESKPSEISAMIVWLPK